MTRFHLALTIGLGLAACGREPPSHDPSPPAPVTGATAPVLDTVVADLFDAAGVAEPIQRAMLSTKLMARVTEVLVHEGDRVVAGQPLARLDARDLAARREQAAAALSAAEAAHRDALTNAGRMRALYADSAAPKAQLDRAEAMLAQAEAGVRQARAAGAEVDAMDDYAVIRAPFSGMVTQRLVDPGAFASPGQPLLVVEDPSRLRLSVTAAPDAVRGLRRGSTLQGTVAGEPVAATVEGVAPAPGGHLVTVNAIVANADAAWSAGSAATLALPLGMRPALLVPAAAVVREGDLTGVYRKRGGPATLIWVRLGPARAGLVEVVAGLAAGDSVVVRPGES